MLNIHVCRRSINRGYRRASKVLGPGWLGMIVLMPIVVACASALPPTPTTPPSPSAVVVPIPTRVVGISPVVAVSTQTALLSTNTAVPPASTPVVVATALSTASSITTPTPIRVVAASSVTENDDGEVVVRAFVTALARNDRAAMLQLTTSRGSRFIPADAADLTGAIEVRTIRAVGAVSATRREMLVALTARLPSERVGSWTNGNNVRFMELTRTVGQEWRINEIATSPIGSVETMGPPPVQTPGRG